MWETTEQRNDANKVLDQPGIGRRLWATLTLWRVIVSRSTLSPKAADKMRQIDCIPFSILKDVFQIRQQCTARCNCCTRR